MKLTPPATPSPSPTALEATPFSPPIPLTSKETSEPRTGPSRSHRSPHHLPYQLRQQYPFNTKAIDNLVKNSLKTHDRLKFHMGRASYLNLHTESKRIRQAVGRSLRYKYPIQGAEERPPHHCRGHTWLSRTNLTCSLET